MSSLVMREGSRTIYCFDDFELDPAESRLARAGQEIKLQPMVFEALLFLASHPGRLVSRQEMVDALWPETSVNEEALSQVIFKLRRALNDGHEGARYIQTVLKRGFRFLPEVRVEIRGALADCKLTGREQPPSSPDAAGVTDEAGLASPVRPPGRPAAAEPERKDPIRSPRWRRARILFLVGSVIFAAGLLVIIRQTLRPAQPATALVKLTNRAHRVQRLTFCPDREEDANFAPDGKSFVFVSKHGGDGLFKLYLMQTSGGNPIRLTRSQDEEHTPRFSPDGKWIAYTRTAWGESRYSVWKAPALGGQESLLAADAALPCWSPDGRAIIFVRALAGGQHALMRLALDGGGEERLLTWPKIDVPVWAPDGTQIAFVSQQAVWVMPARGGEPRRITDVGVKAFSPTWTPDSKAIICSADWGGREHLWLAPLDGAAPAPITAGSGNDLYPSISLDWNYLLYTSEKWRRLVWMVDRQGRRPRQVETKTSYESICVAPNGRLMAYSDIDPSPGDPPGDAILGIMDLETNERRRLGEGRYPAFSADGKRLAFFRRKKEGNELFDMDLATGTARSVTSTWGLDGVEPVWAPDGGRIAFQRAGVGEGTGLTIVETSSGRETFLAAGRFQSLAWSPEGRWIAAVGIASAGSGLYLFEVASRQGKRISEMRSYLAAPIWTADGRALQILVDERTNPSLVTLNLNGVELPPRIRLEFTPDISFWGIFLVKPSPTGWIYHLHQVEGDIYMIDFSAPRNTP